MTGFVPKLYPTMGGLGSCVTLKPLRRDRQGDGDAERGIVYRVAVGLNAAGYDDIAVVGANAEAAGRHADCNLERIDGGSRLPPGQELSSATVDPKRLYRRPMHSLFL